MSAPLRRLALVVPSLTGDGGVPAAARFVKDTALRSGRYAVRLVSLSESARDPHSLRVAVPRTWWTGPTVRLDQWEGLPVAHVGAVGAELEFQRYRPRAPLTGILADCDLVQVVSGSPAWANAVAGLGKPVALHVATRARIERRQRDASPRTVSGWWRRAMTEVTDRMDDRALRRVDAVQAMNAWLFEYATRVTADRPVDVRLVPPGVNTVRFRPREGRDPASEPYVLCVARLDDPRKRITLLLDAYALLPAAIRARVPLVLAGASGPSEAFWRYADAHGLRGRIRFIHAPDGAALLDLYQRASLFALASDEEGFGVVLLEAMACAVPVVSTRSGGPEGIITDGVDGYLVPRDDAAGLAARIQQLLEDTALNMALGCRARGTVEQRFDERVAGEAFLEVWDQLAHRTANH